VVQPNQENATRFLFVLGSVASLAIFSSTMSKNPALALLALDIGANDPPVGLISAISPIPGILVSSLVEPILIGMAGPGSSPSPYSYSRPLPSSTSSSPRYGSLRWRDSTMVSPRPCSCP
jgi:hypothetical protein